MPRPPLLEALTADDFYRIQDLSDPQVSPDGRWVAYVVTTQEREADEARSDLDGELGRPPAAGEQISRI
jgi:dipeptidyl aminopeptidase/acylaminoacyl peptidase